MNAVEIRDLSFTYRKGTQPALRGISLDVGSGTCVAFLGKTGAGKSTLCCTLNGLIPHFHRGSLSGKVGILGQEVSCRQVHELTGFVGLVLQDFESQLFSTRVDLEAAFFPENLGFAQADIARRIELALEIVGLKGFERRQPSSLSGGEKQRLAIASILSGEPRILVLDEPTTDLDPKGKSEVLALARRLRENGQTMILVEHESEELWDIDRILILSEGGVSAQGSPAQILTNPSLLEAHGIRPPAICDFFTRLGATPVPTTAEQAISEFRGRRLCLEEARYRHLVEAEEERKTGYGETIIEVRNLSHAYSGGSEVLKGVSLDVRKGEFLAVVGENGSGKTTLVKHLNGLLMPNSGSVMVVGKDTRQYRKSELGRLVGYVFQNPDHQIFAETVEEELAFGPRNLGVSPAETRIRVAEALASVGLGGCEQKDPFLLTKGERQRVAVGSVLASRPRVLILDEPTTGLDYGETRSMMRLVQRLNQEGYTIITVTHSMWVVGEYAHRAIVMKTGRIAFDGTPRELFRHEELLEDCHLKRPSISDLSTRLGMTLVSVDEMVSCTVGN